MDDQAKVPPKKAKNYWWSWSIGAEELDKQVRQYHELKFTQSYRGVCVLFFLIVMAWSLLLVIGANIFLGSAFPLSIVNVIIGLIPYGVLSIFVYKGHRWALIVLLIYWIVDKVTTTIDIVRYNPNISPLGSLVFLAIGITFIVKALKVENARKKQL